MRILSLDFGGNTGWAIGKTGDLSGITSGAWDIRPMRGESPGMRYIKLRGHLQACLKAYPDIMLAVYEQAHHRGGAPTEYAVGCTTHLQSWAAETSIETTPAHSATIKKFITGKGNAEKGAIIAAVTERGFHPGSHDEADAIAMLLMTIEKFG